MKLEVQLMPDQSPDQLQAAAVIDGALWCLSSETLRKKADPSGMLFSMPLALLGRRQSALFDSADWPVQGFASAAAIIGLCAGIAEDSSVPTMPAGVQAALAEDLLVVARDTWERAHLAFARLPPDDRRQVRPTMVAVEDNLSAAEAAVARLRSHG